MMNSIRFTKCSRVPRLACVVLMASIGGPNIAHAEHAAGDPNIAQAEHAASPSESAAASALTCVETWLDSTAHIIAAVECMDRARQVASRNHSRVLATSLATAVVRDIMMHVLVWMAEFGNPDATPVALRDWRECGSRMESRTTRVVCSTRCVALPEGRLTARVLRGHPRYRA
jgi:hypothetical protein